MQERQETSLQLGPHGTARAAMAMAAMAAAIIQEIWQVVKEWWKRAGARSHGAYRASSGLVQGGLEGT